jgi:class 3 adenylate cyclase
MAERLDPEETQRIIEAAFDVMLDAVHGARGTVNQFLGDGVMALFDGLPEHDHPERALSAALAIQRSLQPLRDEVRAAHGLQFSVRIAVNTGPVVIGMIGQHLRDDYMAIGNTTHLATRLLAVAGPGQIVVSSRTHELIGHAFVCSPLRTSASDGSREPMLAYAVAHAARDRTGVAAGAHAL